MRVLLADYVVENYGKDPVLIACGLPASNKTETMEVVSRVKGYPILRTDIIRKDLLTHEEIFDVKQAASVEKRQRVYDEMFRMADELAAQGEGVILDATFITQDLRGRAAELAAKHNKTFVIQQTQCPEEVSFRRISQRTRKNYESNALTEQAYVNNQKKFETVDLEDLKTIYPGLNIIRLLVDTTSDLTEEWFVIDKVTY